MPVAVILGCGGEDESGPGSGAVAEEGPVHIHGLGVNPKDGSLFIATHTGLFRSTENETGSERVGHQLQDTMGFTVAGPNRFFGSGHPAPGESRPANLGLIRSDDAGRSWKEVSLAGEVDFHALRFAHERIYGFDATGGRVMISRDGGRTWAERDPPAELLDLAIDPEDPRVIIASGQEGTYFSQDEGRSWKPVDDQVGFLAWPAPGALYRLNSEGQVEVSGDARGPWRDRGRIGGPGAAFLAQSEDELYAALTDGTVIQSNDGGRSWRTRSTP